MKKKAFTLIELIAVLVILAILALIVTPLVINIIKKAKVAADKRSIDAYGRSVELAIANYLLDKGDFPTSINDLTIEYSGDQVVCTTTKLNSNSSVYLAGCTVGGRSVDYTYGKKEAITYNVYSVGDEVSYNNVDYYVIKDSETSEANVTLLKAEPLTVEEVNLYGGVGTENNVVNKYAVNDLDYPNVLATAYNKNGYGGMAYYENTTCYYEGRGSYKNGGCTTNYDQSEIKYVVDSWKNSQAPEAIEARLIVFDELTENLGFELQQVDPSSQAYKYTENTPSWGYNNQYYYWTMSRNNDSSSQVWCVSENLFMCSVYVNTGDYGLVRPVITLSKSLIS